MLRQLDKIDIEQEKLNPNVSVDCVVFGFSEGELKLLLIKRKLTEKDKNQVVYALPGNLVKEDEDLDDAASRVLEELTGLENIYLEQFRAFGHPNRIKKAKDKAWLNEIRNQPKARVITVAYFSLINSANVDLNPGGFSEDAFWCPVDSVPELAFDHNDIFLTATQNLKLKIQLEPIAFELLPDKFTMGQLQHLYETILSTELDKRNFRRKIINSGLVYSLDEKQVGVSNKPAQFYKFDKIKYEQMQSGIVNLRVENSLQLFAE